MPKFRRKLAKARNCSLCASDTTVDYKDVVLLKRFVSERGKILGRVRTGICAKHQKQVTRTIKRARFMALLPYVVS
ncbi:30S ribosomal protein S18 [Candidatus Curtissbacteria bacterium]|nr:30S ribosomal protein S18 [Candidatus Curtissbacteria bacterium]